MKIQKKNVLKICKNTTKKESIFEVNDIQSSKYFKKFLIFD